MLKQNRSWKASGLLGLLLAKYHWYKMGCIAWLKFAPGSRPNRIVRSCLIRISTYVRQNDVMLNLALLALSRAPSLNKWLKRQLLDNVLVITPTPNSSVELTPISSGCPEYASWISLNRFTPKKLLEWDRFPDLCLSVLLPFSSSDINKIEVTIKALQRQGCPNWQLLLLPFGGDAISNQKGEFLRDASDPRVVSLAYAEKRGEALCAGAERAIGDLILVLEPGDVLPVHAVSTFVTRMGENPNIKILYADEDVIENGLRHSPQLKPDWSPELLRSYNYFGKPTVVRKPSLISVGSFCSNAGIASEWDLWLRVSESFMDCVATTFIARETQILCHRDKDSNNGRARTDINEAESFKDCLRRHWARFGHAADVVIQEDGTLHAFWDISNPPLVSVIIPNKNRADLLKITLDGLINRTNYSQLEIIVVDNESTEQSTIDLYTEALSNGVRIVEFNEPFNYSRACNRGAAKAKGDLLLFLNNDIAVTRPEWLTELVRQATLPGVGIVGTKLVYPDGVLQHSGVVIGMHVCGLVFHRGKEFDWGPFGSPSVTRNWMGVMGACQLIKRVVFDRVGGFDESYKIAMSDIKLSIDAWKAGYRTVCVPMAKLIHHEGATRGKSNPHEDIVAILKDIHAKGLENDRYFHPGLSAITAIPSLRKSNEPSTLQDINTQYLTLVASNEDLTSVDLFDVHSISAATGLPIEEIYWLPDPGGVIESTDTATRFILDLLRGREDLRIQFPMALSEGANGAFATWLKKKGLSALGIHGQASSFIDAAFDQGIADRARQVMLLEHDIRDKEPFLFMPNRRALLAANLFGASKKGEVSKEAVWWLLMELAENPIRALIWTWQITPNLQIKFPNGITRFGRTTFAQWLKDSNQFGSEIWIDSANWPDVYPIADQIRIAYLNSKSWQDRFPMALLEPRACAEFIEYLKCPEEKLEESVKVLLNGIDAKKLERQLVGFGVNLIGHFSYPSGLRTSTECISKSLATQEIRRSTINVPVSLKSDEPGPSLKHGIELFDISIIHVQPEPFYNEALDRAGISPRKNRPYQIAYWYWEFDSIPALWDTSANQCDEIWTATEFIAKGLRKRYQKPVHVVFPGLEVADFRHFPREYFGLNDEDFVFLFAFHMTSVTERKNPVGLIRAFRKAFGSTNSGPILVIKISFGSFYQDELNRIKEEANGARIRIIDSVFTDDETLSLIDASDAYVSLHRSEGLGLTMAEAMLLGKPTIGTRYSGNLDFMDDNNSLLVDCDIVRLKKTIPPYSAGLEWAEPSEDQAAMHMRRLYDDRKYAKELGDLAKRDLEGRISYAASGLIMANRLRTILSNRNRNYSSNHI